MLVCVFTLQMFIGKMLWLLFFYPFLCSYIFPIFVFGITLRRDWTWFVCLPRRLLSPWFFWEFDWSKEGKIKIVLSATSKTKIVLSASQLGLAVSFWCLLSFILFPYSRFKMHYVLFWGNSAFLATFSLKLSKYHSLGLTAHSISWDDFTRSVTGPT